MLVRRITSIYDMSEAPIPDEEADTETGEEIIFVKYIYLLWKLSDIILYT